MYAAMLKAHKTWQDEDGLPMIDYSTQDLSSRIGKHATTIDLDDFSNFIKLTRGLEFDIMLEIKDKEFSAAQALKVVKYYR